MATRRNLRSGKRKKKLPDPQEVLRKSRKSNNLLHFFTQQRTDRERVFLLTRTEIVKVLPGVALYAGYGWFISLLNYYKLLPEFIPTQAIASSVIGLTLGMVLLLVWRIVRQSDRSDSNRIWKTLDNVSRRLLHGICFYINDLEPQDRYEKESTMGLVTAFAVAMKLQLRQEPVTELKPYVSQLEYKRLQVSDRAPLDIIFWIDDYLKRQHEQERLNVFQLRYLRNCISEMTAIMGNCERTVLKSTRSLYFIVGQIISIAYFLVLPLGVVDRLGWKTGLVSILVSSIYLLLSEISTRMKQVSIGNNSKLHSDAVCKAIERHVKDLIQQSAPSQPKIVIDLPKIA